MEKGPYNGLQTSPSVGRTISVASNFKFENVQKLNTLVGEIGQINKQTAMRSVRAGMSDKVIDLIKNRIKSNYDKLYQNYDVNKKTILRQIQQVQTNIAGQNAISRGFQNVIKQKAHYDKLKADVQAKQKKFKKMVEMRDQLRQIESQSGDFNQILDEKCSLFQNLDQYRQTLDYQTAVLQNMKDQRRKIKLHLKQRYDNMLKEEQLRKHKIDKLVDGNHNKKTILNRIEQTLKKQQQCQIPQNLAQQLQRKLEEYEGKQTYENIIKHETILNDERQKKLQQQLIQQKQEMKRVKIEKEKQDKKQYEIAYNYFLIKQAQQEKIKKICGVSNLGEIVNNSLEADYENLQTIKLEIEMSIENIKMENKNIQKDIQNILTKKVDFSASNLQKVQKQFEEQENDLRNYKIIAQKKTKYLNQWQGIIQLMSKKSIARGQMSQMLKQILKNMTQQKITQDRFRKFSIQEQKQRQVMQSRHQNFNLQTQQEQKIQINNKQKEKSN